MNYKNTTHYRPSLNRYVLIVLVPYMVVSSIAFFVVFPLLDNRITTELTINILLAYWVVVWGIYIIVRLLVSVARIQSKKPEIKGGEPQLDHSAYQPPRVDVVTPEQHT